MKYLITLLFTLVAFTANAQNTTVQVSGSESGLNYFNVGIQQGNTFSYGFDFGMNTQHNLKYFTSTVKTETKFYNETFIGVSASAFIGGETRKRITPQTSAYIGHSFDNIDVMIGVDRFKDTFFFNPLSVRFKFSE